MLYIVHSSNDKACSSVLKTFFVAPKIVKNKPHYSSIFLFLFFKNTFVVSHKAKPENIFVFPDYRRQSRPPQSPNYNNTSASRGGNDVDSMIKSSKLSANAPEFVPLGFNQYDVREQFHTTH